MPAALTKALRLPQDQAPDQASDESRPDLLDRQILLCLCQAVDGKRCMGGMHRVREHHGFVGAKRIEKAAHTALRHKTPINDSGH